MKICVAGLWHLGSVTAACLAHGGSEVAGLDDDSAVIDALSAGRAPLYEPGLDDLIGLGVASRRLRFTTDPSVAVEGAEILWIAFDTPVAEDDTADVSSVTSRVLVLLPLLQAGALVIVSSQLPVGTIRSLERQSGREDISFASLPENLRLGKAIEAFERPDRVVAGVRREEDRARIATLLAPFTDRIEWMSVESAEMTKHALNAFLATSIAFINEIASICEVVGADAKEVERGLKSESRIGPRSYLSPGSAFAGGTLARDVTFLTEMGRRLDEAPPLLSSVIRSNDRHKSWTRRKLSAIPGGLRGRSVAVWGLAYKSGTDTLRRSSSIELCRWLAGQGARVRGHDPAVKSLPSELGTIIDLYPSAAEAARDVDVLVVATEWPEYRAVAREIGSRLLMVIDANRFLSEQFADNQSVQYVTVGRGAA